MLMTILGAVVLAVALCGTIALGFRLFKKPIPKGVLPLVAGVAMVTFTAWNENSWYSRQLEDLPGSVTVLRTGEFSNFIQPWTMIWPRVNRYLAVDSRNVVTLSSDPNVKLTELISAERYTPTRVVNQLVHCERLEGVVIAPTEDPDAVAASAETTWFTIGAEDPLIAAVCD